MAEIQYRKATINATVSPYIKKKADELVANKEFSSISDLVNTALTEFISKYEAEKRAKKEQQAQKSELTRPVTIE